MGRQLYETQATFREALGLCDEILAPLLPQRLLSVMYAKEGDVGFSTRRRTRSRRFFRGGVRALGVVAELGDRAVGGDGHSVGEYVAACVAGVYSLEDGLRLVAARDG